MKIGKFPDFERRNGKGSGSEVEARAKKPTFQSPGHLKPVTERPRKPRDSKTPISWLDASDADSYNY
jgi:hypothetical protein